MSEILSQQEIDELLKALNDGEISINEINEKDSHKKIEVYDWTKPNKFSKDQIKTLRIIYENFTRSFASYFLGILRVYCQAEVFEVEPQTYREFINSLPNPVILCIIDFRPLKGSVLLVFPPDIAFAIIDRILGGPGKSIEKIRDFSEIEIVLFERIIRQLLPLMNDAWSNVMQTDFQLNRIETNAQLAQIISPNEAIAIVTLNVHIGELEGLVNFCIPHMPLEPVINQLSTRFWFSSKTTDESTEIESGFLSRQLESTYLHLRVLLGETTITIKEFLELQQGDVIRLDQKVEDDVDILVENKKKFNGHIGLVKNCLAVQITSIERGSSDKYE